MQGDPAAGHCSCTCHHTQHHFPPQWLSRLCHITSPQETSQVSWLELDRLYHLAQDEIAYATESQGSIYYEGDLKTAQEAMASCLNQYIQLLGHLSKDEFVRLDAQYSDGLERLQDQLNALPPPPSLPCSALPTTTICHPNRTP